MALLYVSAPLFYLAFFPLKFSVYFQHCQAQAGCWQAHNNGVAVGPASGRGSAAPGAEAQHVRGGEDCHHWRSKGQTVKGIVSVIRGLYIWEPYLSSNFLSVLYLYIHCLEYLYSQLLVFTHVGK